jgi:hypothetical protein
MCGGFNAIDTRYELKEIMDLGKDEHEIQTISSPVLEFSLPFLGRFSFFVCVLFSR